MTPERSGPHPSTPASSPTAGGGKSALQRLREQPFMVDDVSEDDEPLFVAIPLKFLGFDRDSGCVVDHPVHSHGGSRG